MPADDGDVSPPRLCNSVKRTYFIRGNLWTFHSDHSYYCNYGFDWVPFICSDWTKGEEGHQII